VLYFAEYSAQATKNGPVCTRLAPKSYIHPDSRARTPWASLNTIDFPLQLTQQT
jgi:hypothetical protein